MTMRVSGSRNKEVKALLITYPATGFKSDVERLLQKFVGTNSIRYDEFVTAWKSMNFSLVHVGRLGIRENREFLEEAFKILIKYILPPFNLQVRVGGIYAIYGLYYTQKLDIRVRVRIPLSCWPDFCELKNDVTENGHLDAVFIINKLILDRVFLICAYPSTLSVDELYLHPDTDLFNIRANPVGQLGGTAWADDGDLVSRLKGEDGFGQLSAVHDKYHQLKCAANALRGGPADVPDFSLDLIRPNLTDGILTLAAKPDEAEAKAVIKKTVRAENTGESSGERAATLERIKKKAQTSKPSAKSSRYAVQTEPPPPAKPKNTLEGWKSRRRGRPTALFEMTASPQEKNEKFSRRRKSGVSLAEKSCDTDEESSESDSYSDPARVRRLPLPDIRPRAYEEDSEGDSDYQPDRVVKVAAATRKMPSRKASQINFSGEESSSQMSDTASTSKSPRKRKTSAPEKAGRSPSHSESSQTSTRKRSRGQDVKREKLEQDSSEPYPSTDGGDQVDLEPDMFVVIRPNRRLVDRPLVGRVVSTRGSREVEIIWYKGLYNTRWTQFMKGPEKDGEDSKMETQVLRRSQVFMTFKMTKYMRLPTKTKEAMKRMYKEFDGEN